MSKFYGIRMMGKFILEKLASLPPFDSNRDIGRMIYVNGNSTGYVGTYDDWIPITGVKVVDSLPNWNEYHIGRLFFLSPEQSLYIGTESGFSKVGGTTGEDFEPDYTSTICRQCAPPSGSDLEINDTYVVCPSGAEDEWAGHENQLTVWDGDQWKFNDPMDYQTVLVECEVTYYVWVDDQGEWKEEVEEVCFNYTDANFYPKTDDNIPPSGAFFEEDVDDNLMPVDTLPGYINLVWEEDGPSAIMPRP